MRKRSFILIALLLSFLYACNFPFLTTTNQDVDREMEESPNDGIESGEPLNLNADLTELAMCTDPQPNLIDDFNVYQAPDVPEPDPRTSFRDPVFGTCIVRVTDRQADLSPDDPSRGAKNEYSRVQSFNADGTLIIVRSIEAHWYVYDAASLQPLGEIPIVVDPRWDANDPYLVYYFDETRLMSYDIQSGSKAVIHDFTQDFPDQSLSAVWTRYEGSPSRDSRYWGLMAQDENGDSVALLVYDLQQDVVTARKMLLGNPSIDAVTISPSGEYFLAYHDDYCEHGDLGSQDHLCGLLVYDRDLKNARGLLRIVGHSDTALDANGRDVLIYQDIDTDNISMLDLQSGQITELVPIDFSYSGIGLHFSGRAFLSPGWALVSTYNGSHPKNHTWMDDVIFAIELKPNPRIVRLAHTHSLYNEDMEQDYWAEPHANANQDFTRVLFTSNWGRSGTEEVDMFMITLPDDWSSQLASN
jgi:hypothetical protein